MKKAIMTTYTDQEFRQIIRDELKAVLSEEDAQIAGPNDQGFIDIKQAAEFLKIKVTSIYNLVHAKKIPFHKSGKRLLFKKTELSEFIITNGPGSK